jgi:5'/3'-nucleotidase SurE
MRSPSDAPLGEVLVVAPLQEASAIGHALTLRRPLRIETISDGVYGVDGTPTDCVNLACAILLKAHARSRRVGINKGWNLATTSPTPAPSPARSRARCSGRRASPCR